MTISKCSCGNTTFERVTQSVNNCDFLIDFIQCASCHTVMGILEHMNNEAQFKKIETRLQSIESKIKR